MSTLKRLFEPVSANPIPYVKGVVQRILVPASDLVYIVLMQAVANGIQNGVTPEQLKKYAILFLMTVIIGFAVKYLVRNRWRPNTQYTSDIYFRERYFKHILQINSSYMEKRGTGRLIEIIQRGIDTRRRTIEMLLHVVPDIIIKLVFSVVIIRQIGPLYAIGYIIFLTGVVWFSIYLNRFALKSRGERKLYDIGMSRRLVKFLMARIEIMYANSLAKETANQHKDLEILRTINVKLNLYFVLMYNIPVAAVQMLVFIIILYTIRTVQDGTFSYATFTGMMSIIGFLSPMVINYTSKLKELSKDFIHVEKLREVIDAAPCIENYDKGVPFAFTRGDIMLNGVTFSYDSKANVLERFDLSIKWWQKTAFVGESWAGKSTIIKMIAWLMAPDQGEVLVDGQPLSEVSLKSYYSHIGYLSQEPAVFDGTIYENLVYALATKPSEAELETVLHHAKCEFVFEFNDGLHTEIGERGIRLSGGQRQRLAIAKVFLKNPGIILLDEPTSALDSFSEEAITQAMRNLFQGRTVLIIAHRLQTVKQAEDIIVLDKGLVIERGTHDQLVQAWGSYARMLELQAGF